MSKRWWVSVFRLEVISADDEMAVAAAETSKLVLAAELLDHEYDRARQRGDLGPFDIHGAHRDRFQLQLAVFELDDLAGEAAAKRPPVSACIG